MYYNVFRLNLLVLVAASPKAALKRDDETAPPADWVSTTHMLMEVGRHMVATMPSTSAESSTLRSAGAIVIATKGIKPKLTPCLRNEREKKAMRAQEAYQH